MHQLKNKTKLDYKKFKENTVFKAWCTTKRKKVFPERSQILAAPHRTWKPELILLCKPVLGLHRSHLELLVQLIHLFRKEPVFKPYLGVSTLPRYIISPKCPHSAKRQSLSKSHRNSRQHLSASSWEVGILRDTKQVCGRLTPWVTDSDEGEADWKQTDSLRMQSTVLFKIRCIVIVTEWRLVNFQRSVKLS